MKQVTASIIEKSEVMPGIYLIWLDSPGIASTAKPGQFVMVACGEETILRRPLSIHRVNGDRIALLFTIVGRGTLWLSERTAGDIVDIFGPLGNGFSINPASKNLLLVAGGIGIAPLVFLTDEVAKQGKEATLLLGAQTASRLYPENLLPPEIELFTATDDGTVGRKGLITDFFPEFTDRADQIFACGPLPMYKTMSQIPELKNKPVQVSLEMRMACGLGVCYGCTVKTRSGLKQVCKDGPVFELSDLDNINWEELIL